MESSLVASAQRMGPLILDHRHETESDRRLAPKIVEALLASRLCRMGLPAELAGLEAHPVEVLQSLETLAGFEASVSWIAWNNSLVSFFSRFLAEAERAELFADPSWLYAQSTRPSGTATAAGDAYRVSGRWSLVSGCELAEWLMLTCQIQQDGEIRRTPDGAPETRFFFVPRADVEILDTWHSGGLRGTGSHDVVVEDLLVPHARSLSPADGSRLDRPIDRVPIMANLFADFAAQALGVAQRTLDTVVEMARTRITAGPVPDLRDRPTAQADVARSATGLTASRDHLHRCVTDVWDRNQSGHPGDPVEIRASISAALYAVETARRAVDAMVAAAGTAALYTDSPIERAQRDLHAMLRHVVAQPVWLEDAGRHHFGLEPESPIFLL